MTHPGPEAHPQRALEQPEVHRLVAAVVTDGAYVVSCGCGWHSTVNGDPLGIFDAWAEHVHLDVG